MARLQVRRIDKMYHLSTEELNICHDSNEPVRNKDSDEGHRDVYGKTALF